MFKINNILNNSFSKNTIRYVFGISLAQLIAFAFQFILRRIYTQEEFGHYAIFTSMVSLITVISTLRYERAILLPKERAKAYQLLVTSIFFVVIVNILIFVIILLFPNLLANIFNISLQKKKILYFVPISGLFFSLFRVFEFYITRQKKYLQLGLSKVVRRFSEGSFQVTFKFIQKSGLFIGDILGHFINLIYGLLLVKKDLSKNRQTPIRLKATIKEFSDFPKYNLWTALAQDLNNVFLPVLLISHFFGAAATGTYDLARLLLSIPIALITMAIQQILFQKLSSMVMGKQNIQTSLQKLFSGLCLLALIGFIIFELSIDKVIPLFGKNWSPAIGFSKILIYSYILKFIFEPFSSIFYVLRKLKLYSIWQTIYFLSISALFLLNFQSIENFLIYYVSIDILFYIIHGTLSYISMLNYQKQI